MTRRSVLAGAIIAAVGGSVSSCRSSGAATAVPAGPDRSAAPAGLDRSAAPAGSIRLTYGSDPSQFGDLYLPAEPGPFPVVVVIHGGFWKAQYDLSLGAPLAADLAARGYAAFNLEYRRVGSGGGWPQSFDDVAAGIDVLAVAGQPLDLSRVATVGHSAGGHLAVWAAGRSGQPAGAPGSAPVVRVTGAVSQAGVLDLVAAAAAGLGGNATQSLLGGELDAVPDRYGLASPQARLPLGIPVLAVHGDADTNVPISQSRGYVDAATAAGDRAELVTVSGDHFVLIDPVSTAWQAVLDRLPGLLGG